MNNPLTSLKHLIVSPFIAKEVGVSTRYVREALALSEHIKSLPREEQEEAVQQFYLTHAEEYDQAHAALEAQGRI